MSDEPKPEKPAATPEAIDPKEVRAQLGLPETAPDADVIAGLLAVIAALSQKYETLLADSAGQEAEIANRTLDAYADRIPAGTADFWRDQLLANRQATVAVLEKLPKPAAEPAPAAPSPAPAPAPTPLRNRLPSTPPDRPPVPDQPGAIDNAKAVAIRNRAHELQKTQRIPYSRAFSQAQAELAK